MVIAVRAHCNPLDKYKYIYVLNPMAGIKCIGAATLTLAANSGL